MHNCCKVYLNNKLICILKSEGQADSLIDMMISFGSPALGWRIVPAYIENIGF